MQNLTLGKFEIQTYEKLGGGFQITCRDLRMDEVALIDAPTNMITLYLCLFSAEGTKPSIYATMPRRDEDPQDHHLDRSYTWQ